jgi:predicted NUDIX family NTP pyrophosphohydrolase
MTKSAAFNGHKNWNHWNVSLWINNDEGLYRIARAHIAETGNRDDAAQRMFRELEGVKTPDGAPYSLSSIRAAMVGM